MPSVGEHSGGGRGDGVVIQPRQQIRCYNGSQRATAYPFPGSALRRRAVSCAQASGVAVSISSVKSWTNSSA